MPQTFLRREMIWTDEVLIALKWYMGNILPDLRSTSLRKEPRTEETRTKEGIQNIQNSKVA